FARGDSIINVLYWNNTAGVLSHDAGIDSVHVDGVLQVNGNETVGGTFGVTGVTTLSDSLYGTNADLAGTTTTTFLRVDSSFALFPTAVASGVGSMAIGEEAVASDVSAIAIGARTEASSYSAIAIGNGATAGMNAVAVGRDATASGEGSVALGDSASVNSPNSNIAIGYGADAGLSGDDSWGTLALGAHSQVAGSQNIAFTMGRVNAGSYNIAMAAGSVVDTVSDGSNGTTGAIAFGFNSKIGERGVSFNAMTFGHLSRANGTNNFAFGSSSFVDSQSGAPSFNNIAFGRSTEILNGSSNSFAFGNTSKIEADAGQYAFNTFTFGNGSVIDGHWPSNSFAFGNESKVSGFNVVNFANNSPARFSNLAMFGQYADTSGFAVTVDANMELDSRSGWIATDPLFVIANGMDDTQRSNAFVMLKDGSLDVTGDVELGSDLEVTGDLAVYANVDVDGTVELRNDLDVDGDTDLDDTDVDGTLDVTGVATLATADINGGAIDGTTLGASVASTVGATTLDASGDVTFNGDNFASYAETSIHNNLIVLDKTYGTTTQFMVNEANGNTMIAGALDMTNFDVDASGNLDLDANLDMDGTTADFQASGAISLDAGSASNFTTTAGALTLEGAGGVTVTSTGGTMALNGVGQTVDLDATTLDVDATTITVDATTTTFTGDVKGPKATDDDEFVTYFQLDSLANQAPYNETYIVTKKDDTYSQTITVGGGEQEVQIMPTAVPLYLGFVVDMSDAVAALDVDGISNNEPISVLASGGASASTQAFNLKEAGMYESTVTLQVTNPNANDAMVTLSLMNYDPGTQSTWDNPRVLSCATEVVYGQYGANAAFNVPVHFNMASTYKMDNENEDVYLVIETVGEDVVIQSFAFSVSRSGE
ncbi:hypothetical protein N8891_06510, partial [Flavobacteriales bacterium]|nr:hypothetical protein [Flavobacteriales bacterium]